jgi:hypothetical protein
MKYGGKLLQYLSQGELRYSIHGDSRSIKLIYFCDHLWKLINTIFPFLFNDEI